jgi:uncharacterized protein YceH (UPF0502 family)
MSTDATPNPLASSSSHDSNHSLSTPGQSSAIQSGGQTGTPFTETAVNWPPIPPLERRILGVLVEKQKTSKSADAYPLTLNALVTGCNQKSNRDPVLDLDEVEVEDGLASLQKKGLVIRITGGRAERFKHTLYENWTRVGPELAVLAELLLRGPQTKGDLRARAARMDPIDTLETLDGILQHLVARRLVVFLTDPDRRGAVVSHGFHTPDELVRAKANAANAPASVMDVEVPIARPIAAVHTPDTVASLEVKLTAAMAEIDGLKARVSMLESSIGELRKQFGLG